MIATRHFLFSYIFLIECSISIAKGVWTQKASFPGTPRGNAMPFSIGSKGYVCAGGDASQSFLKEVWEYNAVNNSWIQNGDFTNTARWQGVSFSIGSKGYFGTGQSTVNFNNDFWEYNSAIDTWSQKASLPAAIRTGAVGFSIGNKGYIGTGYGGNPATNYSDFWEYNPTTNMWTQKANISGARSFAFGLSIGAKGYIGTGYDTLGANVLDDFWEYDTTANVWTQKANYPGGKRNGIDAAHFTIGNYGYVGTGHNSFSSIFYNDFWKYDPVNNLWASILNLPATARLGACGFTINNKGYIGLGYAGPNTCLNDLWEYTDTTSGEGVNEINLDNYFSVYPNPTTGKINVQCTNNIKYKNIEVINVLGEQIQKLAIGSKQLATNSPTIDLSSSPDGIYFVRVQTEKGVVSKKVVVMR